jgi:hypothetical protein
MKKLLALLLMLSALLLPASSWALGSVTVSAPQKYFVQQVGWRMAYTITWIGDASTGTVPGKVIPIIGSNSSQAWYLYSVETAPGSPSPTGGYAITIKDSAGVDLAGGLLASLSATLPNLYLVGLGGFGFPIVLGNLNFALTGNSVASATGTVTLILTAN